MIKLVSVEPGTVPGTHGKKSINICKYKPAMQMREGRLLETTRPILTDRTPNKRSQRQRNVMGLDPFPQSSKAGKTELPLPVRMGEQIEFTLLPQAAKK